MNMNRKRLHFLLASVLTAALLLVSAAQAQPAATSASHENDTELAKKTQNPWLTDKTLLCW
jgi:hypothetical protein